MEGKYIILRDSTSNFDYVIEIRTDNAWHNVTQTGQNSTTIKQNGIIINNDSTIYVYRGSSATINVTSVIYRHISTIQLKI